MRITQLAFLLTSVAACSSSGEASMDDASTVLTDTAAPGDASDAASDTSTAPLDSGVMSDGWSADAPTSDAPSADGSGSDAKGADATGEGGLASETGVGCPTTMPNLGDACTFTGKCDYPDTTAPAGRTCIFDFVCNSGFVAQAPFLTFAAGCPASLPADGASCTCGWHLFGESSPGCTYSCDGGTLLAKCKDIGGLGASGPGSEKWTVPVCGADAG